MINRSLDAELLAMAGHLRALLGERHVSRAAARVGVAQPSMSRTLAKARGLLGDPLLVRTAAGQVLSPRGEQLLRAVDQALKIVGAAVIGPAFAPEQAAGTVKIAATDYVAQLVLPVALAKLRRQAPGLTFELSPWRPPGHDAAALADRAPG